MRGAGALALCLACLPGPNVAQWAPTECDDNSECVGAIGPAAGEDIGAFAGLSGRLMWAGVNTTNATYCAATNVTSSKAGYCWPCAFFALPELSATPELSAISSSFRETGSDASSWSSELVGADADALAAVEGMAQENCYTYNGLLSPTDREWFTLGTDGDGNDIAADSIRAAGCGVCDAMLPAEEQGGTESASTVCKVNGDCQAEHYCDKRPVGGADTCGIGRVFGEGGNPRENGECDEPFLCERGTDAKSDCPGNALVCFSCEGRRDDFTSPGFVHCHEMVMGNSDVAHMFQQFVATTNKAMTIIYATLVLCTLVYPLWCLVVFVLKNTTRCCGGAKYAWGM